MFTDRKVAEVLDPIYGAGTISAGGVSRITKILNYQVNKYHGRVLTDDYIYLIADGVYFNVKNPIWKKRRCVLVVYGIKSNGIRELIDFQLASHGESQQAWEKLLFGLYYRGLEGRNMRLIVRDGNKGLRNAISNVFPTLNQQPCWAHKLRNVSNKLTKKLQPRYVLMKPEIFIKLIVMTRLSEYLNTGLRFGLNLLQMLLNV